MPSRKRSEPRVWDYGADRLTSAPLNEPGYGGRVRSRRDRELLLEKGRTGWTPRHLIGLHRGAETFKVTRRQLHARPDLPKKGRTGWTQRHLIGLPRGAETFKVARRQLHARRGQGGIVAEHLFIRGLADEYAASARSALQTAGQIDFAAKDRVILHLDCGAHQADRRHSCVDATAQEQNRQQGLRWQAGRNARQVFELALPVLLRA